MESKCHPCLPPTLIERFKADDAPFVAKSHIFGDHFGQFRHAACMSPTRSGKEPIPAGNPVVKPNTDSMGSEPGLSELFQVPPELTKNMDNFSQNSRKTWLHFAAVDADVALAHEIVRMGIAIDCKDSDGVTPLLNAMIYLLMLRRISKLAQQPGFLDSVPPPFRTPMEPTYTSGRIQRVREIVILLVKQHADVNAGALDHTPLSLAALAWEWDLMELFLKHGARKHLRPNEFQFTFVEDKNKFETVLRTTKVLRQRPDRPCPCWSGKRLAECHAAGTQPYPDHFICGCSRHKTYDTCCGKRGIKVVERWDDSDKKIVSLEQRSVSVSNDPLLGSALGALSAFQAGLRDNPGMKEQLLEAVKANAGSFLLEKSQRLGRQHLDMLDPAYLYAIDKTGFYPRHWTDTISKVEAHKRMAEFNAAIDRYIRTEGDPRPQLEIEIKSKISSHGGPLYKSCELKSCGKKERRDVDKLQCCSGCKRIFYCSRECQVADYKNHKAECKAKSHPLQLLDSQTEITTLMSDMSDLDGMRNLSL